MTERTHCLKPDACAAARPSTHCRTCSAARLNADPGIVARRLAVIHEKQGGNPEAGRKGREIIAAMRRTPEHQAFMRAVGLSVPRDQLARATAASHAPEAKAKRVRTFRSGIYAGLPEHRWDEAARLLRIGFTAAEAKEIIRRDEVQKARLAIERTAREMRERAARQRAEAY